MSSETPDQNKPQPDSLVSGQVLERVPANEAGHKDTSPELATALPAEVDAYDLATEPELTTPAVPNQRKSKLAKRILGGGLVLLVGAGGYLAGTRGGDTTESQDKSEEPSEVPVEPAESVNEETEETPQEPSSEGIFEPQLSGLELPTSDNPQELAEQLHANLESAINTGDTAYLDYYDDSVSGNIRQHSLEIMQQTEEYKGEGFTDYVLHLDIDVQDDPTFSSTDDMRRMRVVLTETQVLDKFNTNIVTTTTSDLTLSPAEREVIGSDGTIKSVNVWLVSGHKMISSHRVES